MLAMLSSLFEVERLLSKLLAKWLFLSFAAPFSARPYTKKPTIWGRY